MKFTSIFLMLLIISNKTHSRIIVKNKRNLGGKEILMGLGALFTGAAMFFMFSGGEEVENDYAEFIKQIFEGKKKKEMELIVYYFESYAKEMFVKCKISVYQSIDTTD